MTRVICPKCPNCGAPVNNNSNKCEYCKSPLIITSFSEVLNLPDISKYTREYKNFLSPTPASPELNSALAFCYMRLKMYSEAQIFFQHAIEGGLMNPEIFFSRSELHCYTIIFKTTENLILGEATDVYFYQDIVSASTASVNDKITIDGKELIINAEAFKLTTKGGTSLTVNIIDSRHAQESVNAMRALLREKKSS